MILEARKRTPFVHFGFNETYKTAIVNEVVDIYLKTIYSPEFLTDFELLTSGTASIVKVSNYHYKITHTAQGTVNISLKIEKDDPKELNSNVLELEILPITIDSNAITIDNNIITIDSN